MNKNSKINFHEMKCLIEGHEESNLIAFCIDKTCSTQNKFMCLDCMFSPHEQHKMIKLKLIQEKINNSLVNEANKEDELVTEKLKVTEEKIKIEVEKIKTNILEILNNRVNNLITEINDKVNEQKEPKDSNFNIEILTTKELKQLTKEELEQLTNYLINSHINELVNVGLNNPVQFEKKKSSLIELEKFDENFRKYINDLNKSFCEFLSTKFLSTSCSTLFSDAIYFEWSEKTYGNYGFLYLLNQNKMSATKTSSDGTITIIRAKEKLNLSENYLIEFVVESKKYGDVEIGFGKDSVGPSCWLRSPGSYGFTNVGIYENGKVIKKDVRLEDNDVIVFELYLKAPSTGNAGNFTRSCKIIKNTKLVHEFKIEIDEIYPMAAIRKIGNTITVREFKIMN